MWQLYQNFGDSQPDNMKSNCWTNLLFWSCKLLLPIAVLKAYSSQGVRLTQGSRLGPHAMFQIFLQALKMSHRHDCRTFSIGLALEKVATSLHRLRAKLWICWASNEKTYCILVYHITDSRVRWGNLNLPVPSNDSSRAQGRPSPYSRWIVGGKLQFMCSKLCSALKLETGLKAASAPMCVHNMFKTGLPQYTYTRYLQMKDTKCL